MNGWRTSSISGRAILRQVILKQNMEETEEIRPAPSHFKSDVWKHFGFKESRNHNKQGNITNLFNHLKQPVLPEPHAHLF